MSTTADQLATMRSTEIPKAIAATMAIASELGLKAEDAIVLHDSDRIALRLLPCDVCAMVAPRALWDGGAESGAAFEIELAQRLAETGSPVAGLAPRVEPRVHVRDNFVVTLWTYYESLPETSVEQTRTKNVFDAYGKVKVAPADYANALAQLHAGLRQLDVATPHFTDRVAGAQQVVGSRDRSPTLSDADRELLGNTLRDLRHAIVDRGTAEQLLHGEPHPGNLLYTANGLLFIDLGTCCRGPVEFDLAHLPDAVSEHYPSVDRELLRQCRVLTLAMVAAWRSDRDDQFPNRDEWCQTHLGEIRAALER